MEQHVVRTPVIRALVAVAGAFALLLTVGAARADAIIVWQKGNEIWSMKDDFTGQGVLVKLADISGATRLARPNTHNSGKTVVFEAQTATSGNYATGVYKYYGNQITRLSPAHSSCVVKNSNGTTSSCTRRHLDPEVMGTTGNVAFESTYFNSGALLSGTGNLQTLPLAGGSVTNFGPACSGTLKYPSDPAANPTDGTQLAYVGCRDSSDPPKYQLILSKANRSGETVIHSNVDSIVDPSFSTDAKQIVLARRGTIDPNDTSKKPGIWLHNTYQSEFTFGGSTIRYYGSKQVVKMNVGSSESPSPRFIGTDKIIFAAQGELWSVPTSCSACVFPSGATKITTDGADATKVDAAPTWTSQTTLGIYRIAPVAYQPGTYNSDGDANVPADAPDGAYQDADETCPEDNPWDCSTEGGFDAGSSASEEFPPEEQFPAEETPSEFEEFPSEELPGTEEFPGGSGESGGPSDETPPRLSAFKLSRAAFRPFTPAGSRGGTLGTIISFRLSERATVKFSLERATLGRLIQVRSEVGTRVLKQCVKQKRSNKRKRACKRYVTLPGGFSLVGKKKTKFAYTGWWRGKKLPAGNYRLVAVAVDRAKNRSRKARAAFSVK